MFSRLNNYKPDLWQKADELSLERGEMVKFLAENYIKCENLNVVDIGCGNGGTSKIFSGSNFAVGCDIILNASVRYKLNEKFKFVNCDALLLPFKQKSFDLIILQDVIEHLETSSAFFRHLSTLLQESGKIYLSTPNKFSIINFFYDPHWGYPFVSILNRKILRKFVLPIFRSKDANRKDIAQLFSLAEITRLIGNEFEIKILTPSVVKVLFTNPKGILWSKFHLFLLKACKILKISFLIEKFANDKVGTINKFITPTFYLILSQRTQTIPSP